MLACQYAISLQLIYYIVAGRRWAKLPTPTMTLQSWHLILFNYHITVISTQGKSYQLFFNSLINLYLHSSVTFISYRFYKMAPAKVVLKDKQQQYANHEIFCLNGNRCYCSFVQSLSFVCMIYIFSGAVVFFYGLGFSYWWSGMLKTRLDMDFLKVGVP